MPQLAPAHTIADSISDMEAMCMDPRQKVERCIDRVRHSADELRAAAQETENSQARNAFIASAQKVEECIQQCQIALNQFK